MSDETPSTGPEPSGLEAGPETAPVTPAAEAPVPRQLDPVTEVYAPPPAQSLPPAPPLAAELPTEPIASTEPAEPTTTLMAAPFAPPAPAAEPVAPPPPAAFAPPAPITEPVAPVASAPITEPVAPVAPVAFVPPVEAVAPAALAAPVLPEPAPTVPATPPAALAVPAVAPATVPAPAPPSRKSRRVLTGAVFGVIVVILLGAIAWVLYDRFFADPTKNAQAGACLADLPSVDVGEDRAVNAARVVDCNDAAATYVVEGRLDRISDDQAQSPTVCQAYPDATFIYRQSSGRTGYVLCLRQLDK